MEIRQGMDIASVKRFQLSAERQGRSFLKKIFTPLEQSYCETKKNKFEHYAARFAAKEAVMKVLTGPAKHRFRLRDIEIQKRASGKPYISVSEAARKRFGLPKQFRFELSLAHEREYAIATVLLILP